MLERKQSLEWFAREREVGCVSTLQMTVGTKKRKERMTFRQELLSIQHTHNNSINLSPDRKTPAGRNTHVEEERDTVR